MKKTLDKLNTKLPLAVIGAGPKAAALAAKSAAARAEGFDVPEILIIESQEIGANWTGNYGYTNGQQRLGTAPEKDVGFPYSMESCDPRIVGRLFREFSWASYKISKEEWGDWIDRGRPHPHHMEWAKYLTWVIGKSCPILINSDLEKIQQTEDGWRLTVKRTRSQTKTTYDACGLVITGPGPSLRPRGLPTNKRILFGDTFWENLDVLNGIRQGEEEDPIIVVGGGETAASIVSYLADAFDDCAIVILTRGTGTLFSRGEGYYENRMFTQGEDWAKLTEPMRREVINRSDRGVVSVELLKKIALSKNVSHEMREVTKATVNRFGVIVNDKYPCQLLIYAVGFDTCWFRHLLWPRKLRQSLSSNNALENKIGRNLSIANDSLITSHLHLPMLAGLAQGPGYPNLSCLGSLSDKILETYAKLGGSIFV